MNSGDFKNRESYAATGTLDMIIYQGWREPAVPEVGSVSSANYPVGHFHACNQN